MRKLLSLTIVFMVLIITNLLAIEYQALYDNGDITELREEIYSKPYFDETELPRAAFYESLVTSKNFDQTLQELIEGFPEIEYKDQVNFKLGVINFFQRKYSQAEFYFAKIENTNNFNEYNYWLSRLYFMKQEHKQSSKYANMFLENCSKIDHKYELSYYMLIENSISENNFQKAVVLAEELLRNKPEGINKDFLYYRIGYSYERIDNINLAVANYKKSFEINPYGQYAAMTEERLFEMKKSIAQNIDISFLYTKNYNSELNKKPLAYKTEPKEFNVTELVRTDTTTILSKFFNNQSSNHNNLIPDEKLPLGPQGNADEEIPGAEVAKNTLTSDKEVAEIPVKEEEARLNQNPISEKQEENRAIEKVNPNQENQIDEGIFLPRPKNIETEGYVYLMNKPVGKYFIQIGRFSRKEFAVNRTKELFYLLHTWNIIRDVKNDQISYVIWSQPYDTAAQAKKDIAYFKSKSVDCFLVANE